MENVFAPAKIPVVPLFGSAMVFPVHRIYCVGRNYSDHVKEMGGDPKLEPPIFFSKPADAIVTENKPVRYPLATADLHHEVELVVAMGEDGIFGYAVGVDMTRRDLQAQAKDKSRPWEAGKSFAHAAPCSAIQPDSSVMNEAGIQLSINGEVRQSGNVNQMIWKIPEIIERLSELFVLGPGDLIYTGTPAGVGPVEVGDAIEASVEGLPALSFKVHS